MILSLIRNDITELRTLGFLGVNGKFECFTLERPLESLVHAIPDGEYPVKITVSGRAERGELWSPRNGVDLPETDLALPELLDVPGRTAIRIHALNQVSQT